MMSLFKTLLKIAVLVGLFCYWLVFVSIAATIMLGVPLVTIFGAVLKVTIVTFILNLLITKLELGLLSRFPRLPKKAA